MTVWFTSDLHFGHENIIKYCNRPWSSSEEMDEGLISNWNEVVKPADRIYVLGDFSFSGLNKTISIVKRLHGQKYLIFGNHDFHIRRKKTFTDNFLWCKDLEKIKIDGQSIVLCHYAMRVWDGSHVGHWQLYGHSHGTLPDLKDSLSLDVGVDANHYYPISFEEIKQQMQGKNWSSDINRPRR